jgi:hypothetical protein
VDDEIAGMKMTRREAALASHFNPFMLRRIAKTRWCTLRPPPKAAPDLEADVETDLETNDPRLANGENYDPQI